MEEIRIQVPRHIGEWLQILRNEMRDDFTLISKMIIEYYNVWTIARRRLKVEIARKIEELKRRAQSEEARRLLEELEKEIARM